MKILIYNLLIAIISQLVLLPLWYYEKLTDSSIQVIFSILVLPIIMIVFDTVMFLKGKIHSFNILYFILPIACIVSQLVGYFNWGVSTGRFFKPDAETVMLTKFFIIVSLVYSLILVGISNLILKLCKK